VGAEIALFANRAERRLAFAEGAPSLGTKAVASAGVLLAVPAATGGAVLGLAVLGRVVAGTVGIVFVSIVFTGIVAIGGFSNRSNRNKRPTLNATRSSSKHPAAYVIPTVTSIVTESHDFNCRVAGIKSVARCL